MAVEAVAGTCMLMWTKTFRDLGGFRPEYFMYAEDMDLCFKTLRTGFRIYHVPSAEIVHYGGASSASQGSTFSAVMIREALHVYMVLNHGRQYAKAYRLASGGSALLRLLVLAPGLISGCQSAEADAQGSVCAVLVCLVLELWPAEVDEALCRTRIEAG